MADLPLLGSSSGFDLGTACFFSQVDLRAVFASSFTSSFLAEGFFTGFLADDLGVLDGDFYGLF